MPSERFVRGSRDTGTLRGRGRRASRSRWVSICLSASSRRHRALSPEKPTGVSGESRALEAFIREHRFLCHARSSRNQENRRNQRERRRRPNRQTDGTPVQQHSLVFAATSASFHFFTTATRRGGPSQNRRALLPDLRGPTVKTSLGAAPHPLQTPNRAMSSREHPYQLPPLAEAGTPPFAGQKWTRSASQEGVFSLRTPKTTFPLIHRHPRRAQRLARHSTNLHSDNRSLPLLRPHQPRDNAIGPLPTSGNPAQDL